MVDKPDCGPGISGKHANAPAQRPENLVCLWALAEVLQRVEYRQRNGFAPDQIGKSLECGFSNIAFLALDQNNGAISRNTRYRE